jgi:hypothetical protein
MLEGWICLSRKLLDWEWYSDANVARLFIHLLLKANFRDTPWQSRTIKRGQFVASRQRLAEQLSLTIKQIRVAENKLATSGAIVVEGATKFTLYTIVKYEEYQTDQIAGALKGQAKGKQRALKGQQLNKDNKNNNATTKEEDGARPTWLPIPEWEAFEAYRRNIKAPLTDEATRLTLLELARLRDEGHDPKDVLNQSIRNGWRGVFPIKDQNRKGQQPGKHSGFEKQDYREGTDGFVVA